MADRVYEDLGDMELDETTAAKVQDMTEEADRQVQEARVSFRWSLPQVATVKHAAAIMGVPYQTYIKQVVYRQALADVSSAAAVDRLAERVRHLEQLLGAHESDAPPDPAISAISGKVEPLSGQIIAKSVRSRAQ
ncbi:MAG: hypothetical protein KGJ86_12645 [Chloroflexota bacterium]|nr:hypothetical protein [Chloroflexota bacterium]